MYEYYVRTDYFGVGKTVVIDGTNYQIKGHIYYGSQVDIIKPEFVYVPITPNQKGVDFVMPPYLFQSTINKNHRAIDIKKVANLFPGNREWIVCFVVPQKNLKIKYKVVDSQPLQVHFLYASCKSSSYPSVLQYDFTSSRLHGGTK